MKNRMKIITKAILIITLMMLQLTVVACGAEQTEVSSKTDESKSGEPQYIYNPEDIDAAKEQFEYVCSYTNAFGEKDYLFFNSSYAENSSVYGSFYSDYHIADSTMHLYVSGGCLYIVNNNPLFFENNKEIYGSYTDFTIQKIEAFSRLEKRVK